MVKYFARVETSAVNWDFIYFESNKERKSRKGHPDNTPDQNADSALKKKARYQLKKLLQDAGGDVDTTVRRLDVEGTIPDKRYVKKA